jgi:hypothetical protein
VNPQKHLDQHPKETQSAAAAVVVVAVLLLLLAGVVDLGGLRH